MRRAVLALLCLAACSDDPPGPWRVAGGFVRDPEGRAVVLRGMNVSNAHKRPPYLAHHALADFRRIRDEWGMNSVRFLVLWAALEPERGRYDAAYLDEIARRVALAGQAGLHVILDMHQDIYGEGFIAGAGDGAPRWTCAEEHYARFTPIEPWFLNAIDPEVVACVDAFWSTEDLLAAFTEAWRRVAARLAAEPAVVGFDIFNEPLWGSTGAQPFERDHLGPLYERVAAAVRAHAPGWLAFVEPAASRNFGLETALAPRLENIVYAPHSYDAGAEAGGGFPPERRQAILENVSAVALEARRLGAALWIGEYGGMPDKPGIAEYMDAQYDAAAAVLAGSMYWHDGRDSSYGTHTPEGVEKTALLDALVRPYPERVAGEPLAWAYDDAARTLTVRWRPDREIDAPTVISVPARVYPGGVRVECGGCEFRNVAEQLVLHPPEEVETVTVVVRPK